MRNIAPFFNLALGRFADITGIKAKVLLERIFIGTLDDHCIQSGSEQLDIMGVRSTDYNG